MQPSPQKGSLRTIRTFAEDVKRAENNTASVYTAPQQGPSTSPSPQVSQLEKMLSGDIEAHAQENIHISHEDHTHSAFDIRTSAREGMEDATILQNKNMSRPSSLRALKEGFTEWWNKTIEPFAKESAPSTQVLVSVAPPSLVYAEEKPPEDTIKPETPAWTKISEPRSATPLQHTKPEELAQYRAELRALPNKTHFVESSKKPFKEKRLSRPTIPVLPAPTEETPREVPYTEPAVPVQPSYVTPEEAALQAEIRDARERLSRLQNQQEEAPSTSRDIPFVPPPLTEKVTAPIRTYRNDALTDISDNQISVPQIAAREAERREETGTTYRPQKRQLPTSYKPLFISVFVVLFISLAGAGGYLYLNKKPGQVTEQPIVGIATFFKTTTQIPTTLPGDRLTLLKNINALRLSTALGATDFLHIYPAETLAGTEKSIETSTLMRVLDPRVPSTFVRTLENTSMIGAYGTEKAPFIVLKTNQFDAALAGMLAWEKNISIDLAPLFGEPVRKTFDPSSLTGDRTRPAYFSDEIIQNHDVRILYDERGEERILYTFVQNELILITTNHTTLEALLAATR